MTSLENKDMELPVKEEVAATENDVENTAETEVTDSSLENNEVSKTEHKHMEMNIKNFLSRRLLNGSVKIMDGANGGGFYAKYNFDANTGKGYIALLLEYPDGAVVCVPMCNNVCREVSVEGSTIGKWAEPVVVGYFSRDLYDEPKVHRAGKGGGSKADYDSFVKYERPDFKIPIKTIWGQIRRSWEKLPITTYHQAFVLDDVYKVLLELGESKAEENAVYQDETGVYLTRAEIEEAVNCMGYDFLGIRELFERRSLWIKDKGSAGYQFSKKIDGKKVHFYKLRKVSGSEEIAVNTEFCMKYTEDKE